MRVLVAISGGVDSSVAAALLMDQGHEVVGVTMRLWGGASDTGCCSMSEVSDARRAAAQLGIDHHVFDFSAEFDRHVVDPYVADHAAGRTPNPCVECNRHLKFDVLFERADVLGFDAIATGHHARIVAAPGDVVAASGDVDDTDSATPTGTVTPVDADTSGDAEVVDDLRGPDAARPLRIARGADLPKDQSYVLHPIVDAPLDRVLLPIGDLTKARVREIAHDLGLRTAAKPDSQDVCFITRAEGREAFLKERMALHPGTIVDVDGMTVGHTSAVELVTIGQRKGLGLAGGADRRFVLDVDVAARTVTVGPPERLLVDALVVESLRWAGAMSASALDGTEVWVQCSAHASPYAATLERVAEASRSMCSGRGDSPHEVEVVLRWHEPQRRVASGQSVVLYDRSGPDASVLAGGLAR